jgi:3-oxoacyl-[acyl-carrier-protein] synthase II
MTPDEEIVITGLGVVSPIGIGVDEFWSSLVAGTSGVGVREQFAGTDLPIRNAAAVTGFEPKKYVRPRKALKIMCDPIKFACAAAAMATEQAGLVAGEDRSLSPDRIGTVFGTETFFADPNEVADVFRKCTIDQDYHHDRWGEFAMREIQPLWMLKYLPNMAASHISIALDARGPSNSICQGEASSVLALIEAADLIRRGHADAVLAGGTGSQLPLNVALYRGLKGLSHRIDEPEKASRPFEASRDGIVIGEGAGAMMLERASHAKARGAKIFATLSGYARGYSEVGSAGFSNALADCIAESIDVSGMKPEAVGLVNANASGSVEGDAVEATAIRQALGDCPVVAHKSSFGNLGPGTSMVELIGGVLSLNNGLIPATLNHDRTADDCPVNVIAETTPLEKSVVVKDAISTTGQFASVVMTN